MENSNQARDVIDGQLSSAYETILGYSQMIGRRGNEGADDDVVWAWGYFDGVGRR